MCLHFFSLAAYICVTLIRVVNHVSTVDGIIGEHDFNVLTLPNHVLWSDNNNRLYALYNVNGIVKKIYKRDNASFIRFLIASIF